MTYWVNVTDANFGQPILNAAFLSPTGPYYAASYQGNAWYLVGVGQNQSFYVSDAGYYHSATFNTDSVDPNLYYFWVKLVLVPPPPPPPSPPPPPGWL